MDKNINTRSVRDQVSEEEWKCRQELAAFYRMVANLGLTDLIHNHITARVPGTSDQFLINPFGLDYSEITASSLVKIDLDGNVILQPPHAYGINPAGYVIHSAIHAARHDLACIAHTHTPAGVAVSSLAEGLLWMNQNAMRFLDDLAYHDYQGPAMRDEEKASLVADLGTCNNMLLRNHGILAGGRTIGEAYVNLYALERACQIQVQTLSCGLPITQVSADAIEESRRIFQVVRNPPPELRNTYMGAELEWHAALRVLNRQTTDYLD